LTEPTPRHTAHTLKLGPHRLSSGAELPELEVAYVAHGRLDAQGGNAILVTHGYTSGPSMLSAGHHVAESSWAPLLGPGRPLDTSRFYIVCANMLGSSFGTTGPASIDPISGQPYGPDFPAITLEDIVAVQHRLLRQLGVRRLKAVVGPSYGGWQALQWALDHPDMVEAIGVMVSGLKPPPGLSAQSTRERLAQEPGWRLGRHYGGPGMREALFRMRRQTLHSYGLQRLYADRHGSEQAAEQALDTPCREWAERFDPNSLVTLAGAAEHFDVRSRVAEIRARTLFMVCTTDRLFPPDPDTRERLRQLPAELRYVELDSPYGHVASGVEWRRLEADLHWMLQTGTVDTPSPR
jgi:homoserine O-acetyltransferase